VSYGSLSASTSTDIGASPSEQDIGLILRKRAPKVWFKAEAGERHPKKGQWFWSHYDHRWILADMDWAHDQYICATRHEETDNTVQTVTQADIDRLQTKNN